MKSPITRERSLSIAKSVATQVLRREDVQEAAAGAVRAALTRYLSENRAELAATALRYAAEILRRV